jgi:tetratricopeptide (TPR) repeat protein
MRFVLVAGALLALACTGHPPAPPPAPDSPLPAMFDLSSIPPRPALVYKARVDSASGSLEAHDEVPDTNDAATYYKAGMSVLYSNSSAAAAAFYWTSRLSPSWADPYFARWFVLTQTARWRPRRLPDSVRMRMDSLIVLASIRDPFFDERLTMNEFSSTIRSRVAYARNRVDAAVNAANAQRAQAGQAPVLGAPRIEIPHSWYLAFADRHFDSASRELGRLIPKHPDALQLYVYRAKAQYYLGQYDSAAATLAAAIGRIDRRDSTHVLPVYFSREMFYYAIGMSEQQAKHDSAARVAFRNTATENLGFYMAHLHLASQALAEKDTVTALTEARIAADIKPTDPVAQLFLGYSLFNARQPADAVEHLRAAIDADPDYALPYYYEGEAYEAQQDSAAAIGAYRGFLAHASRADALRTSAERAIAALGGAAAR